MRKHPRRDLYQIERENGKTYREIAEMYGVSFQAVAVSCGRSEDAKFRVWTKDRCVYTNLRNWLNENRVSMSEFIRRTGGIPSGGNTAGYGNYFRGECYPPKLTIDKILAVTGLTYEQLWEVDHD